MLNLMQLSKFKKLVLVLSLMYGMVINAQSDEITFKSIYKTALTNGKAYDWLTTFLMR